MGNRLRSAANDERRAVVAQVPVLHHEDIEELEKFAAGTGPLDPAQQLEDMRIMAGWLAKVATGQRMLAEALAVIGDMGTLQVKRHED